MKRRIFTVLLVLGLCVGTASAQFGFGIVYDPTNYANAVLRYSQLVIPSRLHGVFMDPGERTLPLGPDGASFQRCADVHADG